MQIFQEREYVDDSSNIYFALAICHVIRYIFCISICRHVDIFFTSLFFFIEKTLFLHFRISSLPLLLSVVQISEWKGCLMPSDVSCIYWIKAICHRLNEISSIFEYFLPWSFFRLEIGVLGTSWWNSIGGCKWFVYRVWSS